MKVSVYDEDGELIGIAWHEDNVGSVELPPATRLTVATHFAINDGEKQPLSRTVVLPVDTALRIKIRPESKRPGESFEKLLRDAIEREKMVDKEATPVTWWGKFMRWLNG